MYSGRTRIDGITHSGVALKLLEHRVPGALLG
jgi:hypothetical protein